MLGRDVGVEAAAGDLDREGVLPLLAARVDALVAEDALRVVAHVEVVVDLDGLRHRRGVGAVPVEVDAVLVVPLGHVRGQRQVDRRAEELQHHAPGVVDTLGARVHHHVGLDGPRAGGHQRPRSLHLHHTQPAGVLRA